MARRTREEAERTRAAIVEAALGCFEVQGIGGSTVERIAAAAGVTKGAVYHHFGGKRGIFRAIREQVALPLMDRADCALLRSSELPPLDRVERFLAGTLELLEGDRATRMALEVMQFKCEYVGELAGELAGALRHNEQLVRAFRRAYEEAHARGELAAGFTPTVAALETMMFLSGLVRLWLLHSPRSALRANARATIAAHVRARRKP